MKGALVQGLEDSPITATQIAQWTRRDLLLAQVLQYIQTGLPSRVELELRPFWTWRLEVMVHSDYIVWNGRVLVPPAGQSSVQCCMQLFNSYAECFQVWTPRIYCLKQWPQFVAEEFQQFCQGNGICCIKVAPYHPSSNGLAERGVQVFKQGFYKSVRGTESDHIPRFLFLYRLTPHSTTGVSLAELLMGQCLRSKFDLLMPSTQSKVLERQDKQKQEHDQHCCAQCLTKGEKVWALNFWLGERWLRETVVRLKGPVSYEVKLENSKYCCHTAGRRADSSTYCIVQVPTTSDCSD